MAGHEVLVLGIWVRVLVSQLMQYIVKHNELNGDEGIFVTEVLNNILVKVSTFLQTSTPGQELTISIAAEDDIATQFIGLTAEQAEDKAEELGLKLRNWSQIGAGTMDYRTDRVNIWTSDDIVIKANIG